MRVKLEELQVYQLAMELGEKVWDIVSSWNYSATKTVGNQWIRAADSVAANLSEGYGRFFYKENRQFCYYSRGSLYETATWLTKAHNRGLIGEQAFDSLKGDIDTLSLKLNNYIKSIGRK